MLIKTWAVPTVLLNQASDAGGASGGTGGSGGDPNPGDKGGGSGSGDDSSQEKIPLKQHKELLDKYHSLNSMLKKQAEEMEQLKAQRKAESDKALGEKGDFKALYESTKAEVDQWKEKYQKFQGSVFHNEKMRALELELKKQGLKEGSEAIMDLAPLEEMGHEVTSKGRILVHGAEMIAEKLKQKYSFAFSQKKTETVNGGGGGDVGGGADPTELTAEYMIELERKDPKKYKELYPQYVKAYRERQKGG